jgi:hypothetical protein
MRFGSRRGFHTRDTGIPGFHPGLSSCHPCGLMTSDLYFNRKKLMPLVLLAPTIMSPSTSTP